MPFLQSASNYGSPKKATPAVPAAPQPVHKKEEAGAALVAPKSQPKPEQPKEKAFNYSKVQEGVDKARKYIRVQFPIGEKLFTMETAFVQGFLSIKE